MAGQKTEQLVTLQERIAHVLELTGDSLVRLAENLGVNRNTIIAYKKGKGDTKGVVLENLVRHYQVNPAWLLLNQGPVFMARPEPLAAGSRDMDLDDPAPEFEDAQAAAEAVRFLAGIEKCSPKAFYRCVGYLEAAYHQAAQISIEAPPAPQKKTS